MLEMAREIVLCHHERWNGGGYPAGLAGLAIPEAARIMAIVDAYDSLTNQRVYRAGMSERSALEIMRHGRGKDFDPVLLDLFFQNLAAIRAIAAQYPDASDDGAKPGSVFLPGELAAVAGVGGD
jgi:putative two-component system response regulator